MAPPRRQSLASRLLVTYAITVMLVLGVLGFFVERSAREVLLREVEHGLGEQARLLSASLPSDQEEMDALVSRLGEDLDARVTVVDRDGFVLADSHVDPAEMENHASRPEIRAALDGETGTDRRVSESTGFPQTYVAVPTETGWAVRLSLPENVVNEPVADFRRDLITLVAVAAAIGVAVVAVVARFLAQPLSELAEQASTVARGELDIEVHRSSVAELDDLGRAIASVSTELGDRLEEIDSERNTLELVLDSLPQGTLLVDSDDTILYANQSFSELLGPVPESLEQIVPFRIQEVVRRARSSGRQVDVDAEHGLPARVLRVIASPFDDGRALVVVSDVTERRRVDEMRRDFVTNASHELKTPVASILAAAETLQLAIQKAPERVPQFAAQIEASARSLAQLVSDLLDLSRLEGRTSEYGPVDLGALAVEEIERVSGFAEERGVRLDSDISEAWVHGSKPDLGLAVRNLLDNAVRYTNEGGSVTVRVASVGDRAVLSVEDTGVGIPQRDLGRVFERFYRVDVARSRSTGGTGLGLSIVRHVADVHGGEVSVQSELGRGSVFTIRLPLAERP
jgi:two-component system phosphate regulon sensor histidine kinase PhoR